MTSPTIEIHRSNRLENLARALSSAVAAPLSEPLAREWVVVQGRGMALWLNMRLSEQLGVWANADYIYPRHFVQRVFAAVLGEEPTADAAKRYQRERMVWSILAELESLLPRPEFENLTRYIGDDPDGARAFELSSQIARTFDEYLTFRPELLRGWQRMSDTAAPQLDLFAGAPLAQNEAWQQMLWRALVERIGDTHTATLERAFHKALLRRKVPAGLPRRISVFGLSNLPPLYVRVLASLGAHTEVRLFNLSPSREYFEDAQFRSRAPEALQFSGAREGNRLLISQGVLGAEFAKILSTEFSAVGAAELERDDYEPTTSETLLGRLQNNILDHVHGPSRGRQPFPSDDRSIAIHSCHSAIREVEVLFDQVLALLDRGFAPSDILVMMPSVDDYAPLIEAVFERSPEDPRRVPYRISDRRPHGDSAVLEAFSRVLMLAEQRVAASEVLDLLAIAPVHSRFDIQATDLQALTVWVVESGIRWGVSAEHKARAGVVAEPTNSWRFGLDRLLLGFATLSDGQSTTCGVLPYDNIEGSTGALLGRFVQFAETLFVCLDDLRTARTALLWQATLSNLLSTLMAQTADDGWQHQQVLDTLARLVESVEGADFTRPLSLRVVRRWLEEHFDQDREARGFLAGGVTFCAMVPMRSIPFRAVCLLGMNDGAFPRATQRIDFNLIESGPRGRRAGDPNRRVDDRYLFLEALLSAREHFIVSYVGQSVRDNAVLSPSIVVSELLDTLGAQYDAPRRAEFQTGDDGRAPDAPAAAVIGELVTKHPLQPFSPRYFGGESARLFSYEDAYLAGAQLMDGQRLEARPLFDGPLPEVASRDELPLTELVEFFDSPATYLLRRRLDVHFSGEQLAVLDREPVELSGLAAYQLGAPAMELRLRDVPTERIRKLSEATGWLPSGAPGRIAFDKVMESVEQICEVAQRVRKGGTLPSLAFRVPLHGGLTLVGELDHLVAVGRATVQFSRVSARQQLRSWLAHLVLCTLTPTGVKPQSWLIGRRRTGEGAEVLRFNPVEGASSLLADLVELFTLGQTEPLCLFPESSLAFARRMRHPKGNQVTALADANKAWETSELRFVPAIERLYGSGSLLELHGPTGTEPSKNLTFERLSLRVFDALLEHLED
jgi:exodeoxyribonuclease V gamma subunit